MKDDSEQGELLGIIRNLFCHIMSQLPNGAHDTENNTWKMCKTLA